MPSFLVFNSTSKYLDDLLNIDNIYFDQMVDRIYPTELKFNRLNSSDFFFFFFFFFFLWGGGGGGGGRGGGGGGDLNLCISNGTFYTKIYDKRDDFDFDVVNFPFPDGDVPRSISIY